MAAILSPSFAPAGSEATISLTRFVIALVVLARCGSERSQYQREMCGQSSAVDTITRWTCLYKGGMSGSSNACGESLAVQTCRTDPSGSASFLYFTFPIGFLTAVRMSGLSRGALTRYSCIRIGHFHSMTEMSANRSFTRGLETVRRVV